MEKILFTTDRLPTGMEIKTLFPMIQTTGTIEVSKKGLLRGILERKKNESQEIIDQFRNYAPDEANAIIGVQVSTAAQGFSNGSFLYVTYIGTPAIIGEIESH